MIFGSERVPLSVFEREKTKYSPSMFLYFK
jgi:hypothetical protein